MPDNKPLGNAEFDKRLQELTVRSGNGTIPEEESARCTSRQIGAMLGLACGDALGAPAEFQTQEWVREEFGELRDMIGGGPWNPGEWTDDTGMMLCVAEGILANPSDPVPVAGEQFLIWRRTAKDVGSTISAALSAFRGDWAQAAQSTPQVRNGKTAGNGSLMRTLPVALAYPDTQAMLLQSARLSAMTHWDSQAELCCAIYCLWIQEILEDTPLREAWHNALAKGHAVEQQGKLADDTPGPTPLPDGFWERLEAIESLEYSQLQSSGYAGYVVECLEAAVWCCLKASSLEEALVLAVNLAGEADTIAAVAGGAAGAYWRTEGIPQRWLDALYRREDVEQIAERLDALRRHRNIYSTKGLPAFNYNAITDNIIAGRNPLTQLDIETLKELGVTHIVDLRQQHEWAPPKFGVEAINVIAGNGLQRLHLEIIDMDAPTPETLEQFVAHLNKVLSQENSRVYVHCRAGMERTAAVLIAYYARKHGLEYVEALEQLREKRPIFVPLPVQERAVRQWLAS